MHTPVLLQQVIDAIDIKSGAKYIDATAGEGGHTRALLERGANVLAIDWDQDQFEHLKAELKSPLLHVAVGNFSQIGQLARKEHFFPVAGVIFDLGISMRQLSQSARGFSFKYEEEPLDMRIDVKHLEETAADVLNTYTQEELYGLLARYGEDVHSELIAKKVTQVRVKNKFRKVEDLVKVIHGELASCRQGHYHNFSQAASRIFQALRIQVNHEMDNLKSGLKEAVGILQPDGKVAVITFHSAEDRIVKKFIQENGLRQQYSLINNRSNKKFERSAKLRVFSK